jgi:hypothetical protein
MESREAVTSVSCHDASFAAGLLEASVQAVARGRPVLLVAYDLPYPEPLHSVRPIEASFGTAFVLGPGQSSRGIATLTIAMASRLVADESRCADPGLEALRRGNPAARSLPLISLLAGGSGGRLLLNLSHGALAVDVAPC